MTSDLSRLDTLPTDDILFRAKALSEDVPVGKWWWGGNTDVGDITLHGYEAGLGWIDILRLCTDPITDAEHKDTWDKHELSDYFDSYEDYLRHVEEWPARQSLAVWSDTNHGCIDVMRKMVVYEVARNQKLPEDTPRDHPKVYRADVVDVRNKTARFIAGSRQLVDDLVSEVGTLRAQLAETTDLLERARRGQPRQPGGYR